MRNVWILWTAAILASGCKAPEADITGEVSGMSLTGAETIMFGNCFIAIVDQPLTCLDMAWVTRHYNEGESVRDDDFQALQFTFDGDDILEGQFNVTGEATVTSKFVNQRDDALSEQRARAGELIVDNADADWVEGSFNITFDGGQFEGTFLAEYCLNLKDN